MGASDDDLSVGWNRQTYTIVFRRDTALVALRVDRKARAIDAAPIALMTVKPDAHPRLAWNGREYLLVAQHNTLVAQRFTPTLPRMGPEIPLSDTARGADVAAVDGTWLVTWLDTATGRAMYARGFLSTV